jgi:uncharacterized protein (TIGR02246 family)
MRNKMTGGTRGLKFAAILPFLVSLFACRGTIDLAAEANRIRALESEWVEAVKSNDVARFVSYYADDASVFAPNAPIATGQAAIRKLYESLMRAPGFSLTFKSDKVVITNAADMAHTQGAYRLTMNDAQGRPQVEIGKFVVVWRKQADGAWKVFADIFNSDFPAASRVQ